MDCIITDMRLLIICIISSNLFAQPVDDHEFHIRRVGHDHRTHLSFEPLVTWTYQHATKVIDGAPHAKAVGYYDIAGAWTAWNNDEGLGQVVYQIQGNFAGGTPFEPFMASSVGNPMAMNNILTSESLALTDVYWQQTFSDHDVRFRIGKLHVATFFDKNAIANDPVSHFMAGNFTQSITTPMPDHGFGANIAWDVNEVSVLRFGTANSEPRGIHASGFGGTSWEHLFNSAELDVTAKPIIREKEREGHYRFMLWNNGISDPNSGGNIDGWGGLFNFDQVISDAVTVFGRVGWGDADVTLSEFSLSCGFQINKPFGCKNSSTGFAYQYAELSSGGDQTIGEWFYRTKWQDDSSLYIGPVIQYYEDESLNGSVIWGFRTSYSF
jgi:hypothetical protein